MLVIIKITYCSDEQLIWLGATEEFAFRG